MIGALLSSFSRYSKDVTFELYYFVALHGRTDLDAAFGLLSQVVKILQLGPVLDTVDRIVAALQQQFDAMIRDPLISYIFLKFFFFFFLNIILVLTDPMRAVFLSWRRLCQGSICTPVFACTIGSSMFAGIPWPLLLKRSGNTCAQGLPITW
jgi:hypothetical protein